MTASACVRRHPRSHAIHRHTILHLTNSRLEIVDGEVADLVAQVVPIHGRGIADVKLGGITGKGNYCHAVVLRQRSVNTCAASQMSARALP